MTAAVIWRFRPYDHDRAPARPHPGHVPRPGPRRAQAGAYLPAAVFLTWHHRGEPPAAPSVSTAEDGLQGLSGGRQVPPRLKLTGVLARPDALLDVIGNGEAAGGKKAEKHPGFAFSPASCFAFSPAPCLAFSPAPIEETIDEFVPEDGGHEFLQSPLYRLRGGNADKSSVGRAALGIEVGDGPQDERARLGVAKIQRAGEHGQYSQLGGCLFCAGAIRDRRGVGADHDRLEDEARMAGQDGLAAGARRAGTQRDDNKDGIAFAAWIGEAR